MFTFKVIPDGGEAFDVEAGSRDVLIYEKTNKGKTLRDLASGSIAEFYKVAHIAAKRQQMFTGTLAEFEETCEIDKIDSDEDDGEDPTQPGHSTEE